MRIAQVAPPWLPIPPKNYGGTENVIYNLVEEQVKQGLDVTLFASGGTKTSAKLVSFIPKALLEEGVPWKEHLKPYYHLHRAIEAIKDDTFDIVHTHLSTVQDMYLFPLMSEVQTPHVTTLHSNLPFDVQASGKDDTYQYYMEWAPKVPLVAISESARKQQKLPLNFIGVVHHGLSLSEYRPIKRPREKFFLWLGRFSPEKGPHLAIEAARLAGVPLLLASTIDRSSKQSTAYFYDEIKAKVDGEQIKYFGPASTREKISLFSRARGFLNPIEWEEPFGIVMIEAMALNCPVISFERGAAPEIIAHGETGFLVKTLDEMVEYIARVDEIAPGRPREYVERNFSAPVMAEHYMQIYKRAVMRNEQNGMLPRSQTA